MIKVVVGLFINPENGTILIVKRNAMAQFSGSWEFPGGQQEVGENSEECLERQMYQGFNSSCQVFNLFSESTSQMGVQEVQVTAFLAKLEDEIQPFVHEDFKWIGLSNLLAEELVPPMRAIAEKVVATFLG